MIPSLSMLEIQELWAPTGTDPCPDRGPLIAGLDDLPPPPGTGPVV